MIYEVRSQQGDYSDSGSVNLTESKKQTCYFVDENKVCYNVTTDDVKEEVVYSKSLTIGGLLFGGFLALFILVINAD